MSDNTSSTESETARADHWAELGTAAARLEAAMQELNQSLEDLDSAFENVQQSAAQQDHHPEPSVATSPISTAADDD